ncbi:MAG: glycosyltransferase [Bacteroidia bacterium]|nr:glycosyltransferase [Bacteroidia bacterium]
MNLVLFANFFPYQKSEPFLENEFKITGNYFSHIRLFTLYGKEADCRITPTPNTGLYPPVFASAANKKQLFLKGIFNWSPCAFHLKEFFSKKLFLSPAKTYWHLVSLLVSRSVMASPAYKQLVSDLSKHPNTVLYFYWGDNLCWILPYLQKKLPNQKLKVVLRLHGSDLYEHLKGNHAPLRSKIFELASEIYTVSENGKNYLTNKYPSFANKINVSRLGVADYGNNPVNTNGAKTVVSVSNLVPLKRVHLIFEALQNLSHDITWYHFGDGPLLEELKTLSLQARAGLQIKWQGFVSNKALMDFYKTNPVNVFINVSSSEGLPVSVMEAFSFGIPAIATNVGGVSELVNAKTGLLLHKDFEIKELSESIDSVLNAETPKALDLRRQARLAYEENVSLNNYHLFYRNLQRLND